MGWEWAGGPNQVDFANVISEAVGIWDQNPGQEHVYSPTMVVLPRKRQKYECPGVGTPFLQGVGC